MLALFCHTEIGVTNRMEILISCNFNNFAFCAIWQCLVHSGLEAVPLKLFLHAVVTEGHTHTGLFKLGFIVTFAKISVNVKTNHCNLTIF